jgi:hypothetical protein
MFRNRRLISEIYCSDSHTHSLLKEKACRKKSDKNMYISEMLHFCLNRYFRHDPVSSDASILMKICRLESIVCSPVSTWHLMSRKERHFSPDLVSTCLLRSFWRMSLMRNPRTMFGCQRTLHFMRIWMPTEAWAFTKRTAPIQHCLFVINAILMLSFYNIVRTSDCRQHRVKP